jgi:hypothetical protein
MNQSRVELIKKLDVEPLHHQSKQSNGVTRRRLHTKVYAVCLQYNIDQITQPK